MRMNGTEHFSAKLAVGRCFAGRVFCNFHADRTGAGAASTPGRTAIRNRTHREWKTRYLPFAGEIFSTARGLDRMFYIE
jgi:hypothetical protein